MAIPKIAGIIPAGRLNTAFSRFTLMDQMSGDRMSNDRMSAPPTGSFDAGLPGTSLTVRITSLHEAKVFARRWVIRDKDPALKALLRHMEKANSSATADSAIRQLKQALAHRGMLVTATAHLSDPPHAR